MNYGIFDLLKLLGSLGFFLYGMKLMSESLQRVAGDRMRTILAAMTANKFRGILTGFLITAIVQSSSATTVMLVSFVNAGLVTLTESIGVVMGTNIGTTVTAWLISILGFKIKIAHVVLPLIGLSLPLLFSKNSHKSNWGSVIVGFAIIFIGLDFLQASTPDIKNNPEMLAFFVRYSNFGFGSVLIFLLIGVGLTMIIQSSSATMALTLVMCYNGWVSFEMAAAMVLGQNIGTTITANLAALVANTSAKRTAMAHLLFNVAGVLLILVVFYPFLHLVEMVVLKTGFKSPFPSLSQSAKETAEAMPIALSIFHTIFNILNTVIMIWFVPSIVKAVTYMVKQREGEEDFKLQFINTGMLSTVELSMLQAKKEIDIFAGRITNMFCQTKELIVTTSNKKYGKLFDNIRKGEEVSDELEIEIATYLTKITGEAVSTHSTEDINVMLSVIDYLESIGDSCFVIASSYTRKRESKIEFTPKIDENIQSLILVIDELLEEMMKGFGEHEVKIDLNKVYALIKKLDELSLKLQTDRFKNLRKGDIKIKVGIIYSGICEEFAKIGKYILGISKVMLHEQTHIN
ncbi:Na/Pi cotransporter family protein [Bacteroidales bacterium]|nr:Na/Pi cotransporter family protein [Bacteroidales bacterium]